MLELQQKPEFRKKIGVSIFERPSVKVVSSPTSVHSIMYTDDNIRELFDVRLFPRRRFGKDVKVLEDLNLSFEESKYLIKKLHLSVATISQMLNDHSVSEISTLHGDGFSVDEISSIFSCNYSVKEVHEVAQMIGSKMTYDVKSRENYSFLLGVKKLCTQTYENETEAANAYASIYDLVPSELCRSMIGFLANLRNGPFDGGVSGGIGKASTSSYEEIITQHMDMAGGNFLSYVGIFDLKTSSAKLFEAVEKVIAFFKGSEYTEAVDLFPIKPILLALVWLDLIYSLEKKYIGETSEDIQNVAAKAAISSIISLLCGVTGYFHSGGAGLPVNPTGILASTFKVSKMIQEKCPALGEMIPPFLKNSPGGIDKMSKEQQKSVTQTLAMLYTFRVGDTNLICLRDKKIFSKEGCMLAFKSAWPLPTQAESTRMYLLYSGLPLYSEMNFEGVFITIE